MVSMSLKANPFLMNYCKNGLRGNDWELLPAKWNRRLCLSWPVISAFDAVLRSAWWAIKNAKHWAWTILSSTILKMRSLSPSERYGCLSPKTQNNRDNLGTYIKGSPIKIIRRALSYGVFKLLPIFYRIRTLPSSCFDPDSIFGVTARSRSRILLSVRIRS